MKLRRITKQQLENQAFAKMYKFLIDIPELDSDSIVLYTMLRDRFNLSLANNWVNKYGEVYLIYTIDDMCKLIKRSRQKIYKSLGKLKEVGLIETERSGYNKPNHIYMTDASDFSYIKGCSQIIHPIVPESYTNKTNNIKTEKTYYCIGTDEHVDAYLDIFKQHFNQTHRRVAEQDFTPLYKYSIEQIQLMANEHFKESNNMDQCSIDYFIKTIFRYKGIEEEETL